MGSEFTFVTQIQKVFDDIKQVRGAKVKEARASCSLRILRSRVCSCCQSENLLSSVCHVECFKGSKRAT